MADNTAPSNAGTTDVQKTCFLIAPIDKEGSEIRTHSDQVLDGLIKPAVEKCGYNEVLRADGQSEPGMLMTQIIEKVITADLVIADLSFSNPNVYYELAVRHCSENPVIQIIRDGERPRFDLTGVRTITFDRSDLGTNIRFTEELISQIEAVEKNPKACVNPITQANLQLQFGASDNPVEAMTTQILGLVQIIAQTLLHKRSTASDDATLTLVRDIFGELSSILEVNHTRFPDDTAFKRCLELMWQIGGIFVGCVYGPDSRLVMCTPTSRTGFPRLRVCARETLGEVGPRIRQSSMLAVLQQYLK